MSRFKFQKKFNTKKQKNNCKQIFELVDMPKNNGTETTTYESNGVRRFEQNFLS